MSIARCWRKIFSRGATAFFLSATTWSLQGSSLAYANDCQRIALFAGRHLEAIDDMAKLLIAIESPDSSPAIVSQFERLLLEKQEDLLKQASAEGVEMSLDQLRAHVGDRARALQKEQETAAAESEKKKEELRETERAFFLPTPFKLPRDTYDRRLRVVDTGREVAFDFGRPPIRVSQGSTFEFGPLRNVPLFHHHGDQEHKLAGVTTEGEILVVHQNPSDRNGHTDFNLHVSQGAGGIPHASERKYRFFPGIFLTAGLDGSILRRSNDNPREIRLTNPSGQTQLLGTLPKSDGRLKAAVFGDLVAIVNDITNSITVFSRGAWTRFGNHKWDTADGIYNIFTDGNLLYLHGRSGIVLVADPHSIEERIDSWSGRSIKIPKTLSQVSLGNAGFTLDPYSRWGYAFAHEGKDRGLQVTLLDFQDPTKVKQYRCTVPHELVGTTAEPGSGKVLSLSADGKRVIVSMGEVKEAQNVVSFPTAWLRERCGL